MRDIKGTVLYVFNSFLFYGLLQFINTVQSISDGQQFILIFLITIYFFISSYMYLKCGTISMTN